jgi:UDP-glucuronate 4-epimerase
MKIFITGSAGFIGFHLCKRLLDDGHDVLGVDDLNAYYDVNLKKARLSMLTPYHNFKFKRLNIADRESMASIFAENHFDRVVNLAAQAGVRYSLENPYAYIDANVSGFMNILEGCRHFRVPHLIYASSSSVYGLNTLMPFSVHHNVDHPVSLYAATKKSNELMAHAYSYLYGLPVTGLRFFTVYGPWGRPDMALFLFTRAILADEPIKVFNHGNLERDFTYIDDIIEGVVNVMDLIPPGNPQWNSDRPDPGTSKVAYRLYNIGNNQPVALMEFIETIENVLGKKAKKEFLPMQPGDVPSTFADVQDLESDIGFKPNTPIKKGIQKFMEWYLDYYKKLP